MSCHRMASINPAALNTANTSVTPYVGNSFVSRNDTLFKDQLLLDFAWSIQGNLDTLGIKSYLANLKKISDYSLKKTTLLSSNVVFYYLFFCTFLIHSTQSSWRTFCRPSSLFSCSRIYWHYSFFF